MNRPPLNPIFDDMIPVHVDRLQKQIVEADIWPEPGYLVFRTNPFGAPGEYDPFGTVTGPQADVLIAAGAIDHRKLYRGGTWHPGR